MFILRLGRWEGGLWFYWSY